MYLVVYLFQDIKINQDYKKENWLKYVKYPIICIIQTRLIKSL